MKDKTGEKKNELVFYRHLRGSKTKNFPNETAHGTVCVIYNEKAMNPFKLGAALCSKRDVEQFNKKIGRKISYGRAESFSGDANLLRANLSFKNMAVKFYGGLHFEEPATDRTDWFVNNWIALQKSLKQFYYDIKVFVNKKEKAK